MPITGRGSKVAGVIVIVLVLGAWPASEYWQSKKREIFSKEAWAYFKKKCETGAGEKIYKTFSGVRSVLVVKPLPPATERDLYDQFWYGDPYSDSVPWGKRAETAALTLASPSAPISSDRKGPGFEFVESVASEKNTKKIVKYYYKAGTKGHVTEPVEHPASRFGIAWEDVSTPEDRKYWVAGSRLSIIDLTSNKVVAERVGFFIEAGFGSQAGQRRPWLTSKGPKTTCPEAHDYADRWFILKVLQPLGARNDGK